MTYCRATSVSKAPPSSQQRSGSLQGGSSGLAFDSGGGHGTPFLPEGRGNALWVEFNSTKIWADCGQIRSDFDNFPADFDQTWTDIDQCLVDRFRLTARDPPPHPSTVRPTGSF